MFFRDGIKADTEVSLHNGKRLLVDDGSLITIVLPALHVVPDIARLRET